MLVLLSSLFIEASVISGGQLMKKLINDQCMETHDYWVLSPKQNNTIAFKAQKTLWKVM